MTSPTCTVRVATDADLRAVAEIHIASWEDAYKGIVPDDLLLGRTIEGSIRGWRSTLTKYPRNINVATSERGVVLGFCCAGPVVDTEKNAPFEFEIYGIHVSPAHRQRGIGAALLRDALDRARGRERMNSAIVWTLRDLTLSRKFYEREGGALVKTGVWKIGDHELPEVAYGWAYLRASHSAAIIRERE